MNRKIYRKIVSICCASGMFILPNVTYANSTVIEEMNKTENMEYEIPSYSMTPSDKKWSSLSYADQLKQCDIPEHELIELPTAVLLQLAFEYPFSIDALAFDNYYDGVKHLKETSNVYKVLLDREDLACEIIKTYKGHKLNNIEKIIDDVVIGYLWDEGNITIDEKMQAVELQLVDSNNDFGSFLYNVLADYDIKINKSVVMAATEGFSTSGSVVTTWVGTTCLEGTYTKYGKGAQCYRYSSGDYTDSQKSSINASTGSAHSNWIYKATATRKYNCHSYCWINQSATNIYWLEDPTPYTTATSYFTARVNDSSLSAGDYVLIYNSNGLVHSAVAKTSSTGNNKTSYLTSATVISKFGSLGLYQTSLYDAYQFYSGTRYKAYSPR